MKPVLCHVYGDSCSVWVEVESVEFRGSQFSGARKIILNVKPITEAEKGRYTHATLFTDTGEVFQTVECAPYCEFDKDITMHLRIVFDLLD